jgi:hypothetical protein
MLNLMEFGSSCSTAPVDRDVTWRVVSNDPGTKMRIHVDQHADHRGMPMPLRLRFGEHQIDVLEVLDQWYGSDYRYIKVRADDGGLYILRFDEPHAEWALTMFVSDARARVRRA